MISKKELLATWQPAREKHLASCAILVAEATERVRNEFASALASAATNGGSISVSVVKRNTSADYETILDEVRDAGYTVIVNSEGGQVVYEITWCPEVHPVCLSRAADAEAAKGV